MNTRLQATQAIWKAYAAAMALLLITSIFVDGGLGAGHVILGIFVSGATFISTGSVWNWGNVKDLDEVIASKSSKSGKRKRIDTLLDQLDEADLQALRERLMLEEDTVRYSMGDDGELVQRR